MRDQLESKNLIVFLCVNKLSTFSEALILPPPPREQDTPTVPTLTPDLRDQAGQLSSGNQGV